MPVKNVTKTPLVAGQWQRKNGKFDLVIAENKTAPNIPVGGNEAASRSRNGHRRQPSGCRSSRARENALLERVSKRFGAVVVADGIDLALNEGEALGIIGPNGAGKTTLFGIATGTVKPDAGRVLFAGDDVTAASGGAALPAWVWRARSRSRSRSPA